LGIGQLLGRQLGWGLGLKRLWLQRRQRLEGEALRRRLLLWRQLVRRRGLGIGQLWGLLWRLGLLVLGHVVVVGALDVVVHGFGAGRREVADFTQVHAGGLELVHQGAGLLVLRLGAALAEVEHGGSAEAVSSGLLLDEVGEEGLGDVAGRLVRRVGAGAASELRTLAAA
jgi:hypothetical protein